MQAGNISYINALFSISSQTDSSGTTCFIRESNGKLVSERTPSGTFYSLFDGLGSVVGLADSSGEVNNDTYDPYGVILHETAGVTNPWHYAEAPLRAVRA
ncbi:MAG TPA: hypothetical protein VF043_14025 [Ktedonobacteraceae bacterium]